MKNRSKKEKLREILVDYDYLEGLAKYSKNGEFVSSVKIPNQVFDPLSIAYFFRLKVLVPESILILPTCDGKSFRKIMVKTGLKKRFLCLLVAFMQLKPIRRWKTFEAFSRKAQTAFSEFGTQQIKRIPVKNKQ